jgi:formylglycine-generating enzyme required for sulfatase activity
MKKESINLDALFQQASKMPVQTSFDDTRNAFLKSLESKKGKKSRFSRFKTGLIMIGIIASGLIILMLSLNTNTKNNETNVSPLVETTENSKATFVEHEKRNTIPSYEKMSQKELEKLSLLASAKKDTLLPPSFHRSKLSLLPPPEFTFNFAHDRRTKKDTLEIPTLTKDEVEKNTKQKKKMLKALAKKDKAVYAFIPSGKSNYKGFSYSVQAFYMQTTEVTNLEYRTFLNDLLIQGRVEDFRIASPQKEQWTARTSGDMKAMQNLYDNHPAYNNYPVVNITRKGAEMYCTWLTEELGKSKFVDDPSLASLVRLPQRTEWVYAASGGKRNVKFPWGGSSTQNAKSCYLANYMPDSLHYADDGGMYTVAVDSYIPNTFGLYNMSGNVAEMVYGGTQFKSKQDLVRYSRDAGTAGGGWMDDEEALRIEGKDPYTGEKEGHPNIGFRPVLTFLRKTK